MPATDSDSLFNSFLAVQLRDACRDRAGRLQKHTLPLEYAETKPTQYTNGAAWLCILY